MAVASLRATLQVVCRAYNLPEEEVLQQYAPSPAPALPPNSNRKKPGRKPKAVLAAEAEMAEAAQVMRAAFYVHLDAALGLEAAQSVVVDEDFDLEALLLQSLEEMP